MEVPGFCTSGRACPGPIVLTCLEPSDRDLLMARTLRTKAARPCPFVPPVSRRRLAWEPRHQVKWYDRALVLKKKRSAKHGSLTIIWKRIQETTFLKRGIVGRGANKDSHLERAFVLRLSGSQIHKLENFGWLVRPSRALPLTCPNVTNQEPWKKQEKKT